MAYSFVSNLYILYICLCWYMFNVAMSFSRCALRRRPTRRKRYVKNVMYRSYFLTLHTHPHIYIDTYTHTYIYVGISLYMLYIHIYVCTNDLIGLNFVKRCEKCVRSLYDGCYTRSTQIMSSITMLYVYIRSEQSWCDEHLYLRLRRPDFFPRNTYIRIREIYLSSGGAKRKDRRTLTVAFKQSRAIARRNRVNVYHIHAESKLRMRQSGSRISNRDVIPRSRGNHSIFYSCASTLA